MFRRPPRHPVLHRRVLVNLKTGKAIAGVLMEDPGPLLVLKDAALFETGSAGTPLDGDVVIERAHVDFIHALAVPDLHALPSPPEA